MVGRHDGKGGGDRAAGEGKGQRGGPTTALRRTRHPSLLHRARPRRLDKDETGTAPRRNEKTAGLGRFLFGNLVDPTRGPWMASNQSFHGKPASFCRAEPSDRFDRVARTGRMEFAVSVRMERPQGSMIRGEGRLISLDDPDEQGLHNSFARVSEDTTAVSIALKSFLIAPGRTRNATSYPGLMASILASSTERMRRRTLLRSTADFDTFVPTTTAKRESDRPFLRYFNPHTASKTPLPSAKSALISFSWRSRS